MELKIPYLYYYCFKVINFVLLFKHNMNMHVYFIQVNFANNLK